jgi:hypothetical protein
MMKVEYGALKEAGLAADDRQRLFYSLPEPLCRVLDVLEIYASQLHCSPSAGHGWLDNSLLPFSNR